ncbi:hypothetical protein AB6A40_003904 [Gnathostoma spinigerum]|uniref:Beta-1,4-N-acetylgalactosaminyltransferase n=1 Tax=Gnathostoma spinigerum TaxID=75299 RepID=A0ABD6EAY0_9BILA
MRSKDSFYDGRRLCLWKSTFINILCSLFALICFLFILSFVQHRASSLHSESQTSTSFVRHLLCVLVPYRNREFELRKFLPHMHEFLLRQNVTHRIIILNQTDSYRFNRASLINVGWNEADRLGCDYLVMHDVDLLPMNQQLDYTFPGFGIVRHISSPQYHPRYNYTKFVGGVLMLTMNDYKTVNGMSNKYWGWGLEDDEFYVRLKEAGLINNLQRPANLTTDRSNTFLHIHDPRNRKRDSVRIGNQKKMSRQRDRISGLDSVKYDIVSRDLIPLSADDNHSFVASVVNVQLHCNMTWTPYCVLPKHL